MTTLDGVDQGDVGRVRAFVRDKKLTYQVALDPRHEVARLFGITGLPATVLVGPDGYIKGVAYGPKEWDGKEARALIASLLSAKEGAGSMKARVLGLTAVLGALGATLANLGCCGAGLLGSAAGLGALGALVPAAAGAWGYETMYVSFAPALAGLATSAWRRRSVGPLALALVGGAGLLLAFHESWDSVRPAQGSRRGGAPCSLRSAVFCRSGSSCSAWAAAPSWRSPCSTRGS